MNQQPLGEAADYSEDVIPHDDTDNGEVVDLTDYDQSIHRLFPDHHAGEVALRNALEHGVADPSRVKKNIDAWADTRPHNDWVGSIPTDRTQR